MPLTSPPRSGSKPNAKPNLFTPTPPSRFESFLTNPSLFLAEYIYTHQAPISPPSHLSNSPSDPRIKLVCISDTHNSRPPIATGDVLIHAGDLSVNGSVAEVKAQADWLAGLKRRKGRGEEGFEQIVVIAGNHETCLDAIYPPNSHLRSQQRTRTGIQGALDTNSKPKTKEKGNRRRRDGDVRINWDDIAYLETQSTKLTLQTRTLHIYASPLTPQYGNWVFQYPPHRNIWHNTLPANTDILITHGPPRGHLDYTGLYHAGCPHLLREIWRVKPQVHVCGHIHCARGVEVLDWGWVQWGYDIIVAGEAGRGWRLGWRVCVLVLMSLMWIWEWISWVILGRKRRGMGWIVNAAIVGDGRVEGVVMEI
ncbi:Metallo-dependent phosphatase-like protein [Paraphoma chrysanthemicola]|nr:Metallo-dependent phosphatase-like protein [Paraphoma chrysanthemicola]